MTALLIIAATLAAAVATYKLTKPDLGSVIVGFALIAAEIIAGCVALVALT